VSLPLWFCSRPWREAPAGRLRCIAPPSRGGGSEFSQVSLLVVQVSPCKKEPWAWQPPASPAHWHSGGSRGERGVGGGSRSGGDGALPRRPRKRPLTRNTGGFLNLLKTRGAASYHTYDTSNKRGKKQLEILHQYSHSLDFYQWNFILHSICNENNYWILLFSTRFVPMYTILCTRWTGNVVIVSLCFRSNILSEHVNQPRCAVLFSYTHACI
jgi:hypothetical protein